jgi:hypothetical protein
MAKDKKSKSVVICEYISTGINYVDDALARGYTPVLVEGTYIGAQEHVERFRDIRERINRRMEGRVQIIKENPDYDEILRQVRETDPAVVVAGSEFGVGLAARLAADLGLPGNPVESIPAMTEKDEMHRALSEHGLRSIHGVVVTNEEEAISFYRELGEQEVVVKPARGAGTQGVYLCESEDEMVSAVRTLLETAERQGFSDSKVLVQERIIGTEYVVNTVSCNGKHRVVSIGQYDKYKLSNGTNAYNYFRYISRLEVGHSALLAYACSVADAIGVKYGPIHGEYMVDKDGPVLIEVNCRPMGGGLERRYSELISGQHETDSALDSYLDPVKFHNDSLKPYRLKRSGVSKDLVFIRDTEILSAPVLQICKRLRSYYSASFDMIGRTDMVKQTSDMESEAGLVYLLHDSEQQVRDDCDLLHLLEMKYPKILYQEPSDPEAEERPPVSRDIDFVMEAAGCCGSTIVFTDTEYTSEGIAVVTGSELSEAFDSYEQGILDLSDPFSFADLESVIQQIFVFMDKVRVGGRVLVPESTYCNMPYGLEGMEILLRVYGAAIELPASDAPGLLIATIQ